MRELIIGVVCAAAGAYAAFLGAPAAKAESCSYELSPPQLATLSGGLVQVTASIKPTGCDGHAHPSRSTVCVSSADSNGKCAQGLGWEEVRVYADPIAWASTVSNGSGCFFTGNPPTNTCTPYGPNHHSG
jgi:hypothetical protein